jgi:hypothetical protein
MSNKRGQKRAPRELAVQTNGTESVYGRDPARYGFEVDDSRADSPLLAALRVQGEPPVSAIVAELRGLHERFRDQAAWADVAGHYAAIAAHCPVRGPSGSGEVGDMPVRKLREAFATGNGDGLILAGAGWSDPANVLRGRAIFGARRQFVPASAQLDPLWGVLGIREPVAADALEVAREIAAGGELVPGDREALVEAYRFLAEALESNARLRRDIARLPLLTTKGWRSDRPILAAEDRPLHDALKPHLAMWELPCALDSLNQLPAALGVEVVSRDSLPATGLAGSYDADEELVEIWERALDHLADYVAQADQQLWQAGAWNALRSVKLVVAPGLTVTVKVGSRRAVALDQRAHIDAASNTLFLRDESVFRDRELGGQLVSRFFTRDRREVALAFVDAWRRAEEAPPIELLRLTEEQAASDELERLGKRARSAKGKPLFSGAGATRSAPPPRRPPRTDAPRVLKDFRNASIESVQLIEGGERKQVIKATRPKLIDPPSYVPRRVNDSGAAPRSYTETDREDEALRLLAVALKTIDGASLRDYRHLPVGADSVDELRRFFEIKAFAGEIRDEIRLEPSQLQRALRNTDAFFLAIVSGLETGTTRIRIIANPIRELTITDGRQLRVGGVTTAKALELVIATDTSDP